MAFIKAVLITAEQIGERAVIKPMPVQAPYPDGQVTAGMHLSHDGSRLVVPTMDAQAFDVAPGKIDAYVREHHLSSYLRVFDISTGEKVLCEKVPAWISHVQFSPVDREVILYANERPSDCGIRRMWLWTGKEHRRLRTEGESRSKDDWTAMKCGNAMARASSTTALTSMAAPTLAA